jgi:predicted phage tail protein
MTASAGRRRRRSEGSRRIASQRRIGGLIRWQAAPRRAGGARPGLWAAVAGAAVLLTLAVIAARTAGWLHWGNLLMLVPAGVLVMVFGAGLVAMLRRAVAWLAG